LEEFGADAAMAGLPVDCPARSNTGGALRPMNLNPRLMVVVVVIIVIMTVMDDHNLVVVLLVTVTVMNLDNLVVIIVTIVMTNLDHFAMMVPVLVFVADVDGYAAFLSDHDRLVDCGRTGQRRSAQDCKRARDEYQFVHVTFLHEVMLLPCAAVKRYVVRLRVTRRGKPGKRWLVPPHSKKYACKRKNSPGNEHVFRKPAPATPDRPMSIPGAERAAVGMLVTARGHLHSVGRDGGVRPFHHHLMADLARGGAAVPGGQA
jgi:hypothetical protein